MRYYVIIPLLVFTLTGCSELNIIVNSANKEIRAEAINVEWQSRRENKPTEIEPVQHVQKKKVMAKAEVTFSPFRRNASGKKESPQKALWQKL
jgi:hypothetical protein